MRVGDSRACQILEEREEREEIEQCLSALISNCFLVAASCSECAFHPFLFLV